MDEPDPEVFGKVALGKQLPKGSCQTCGCPPDQMPMINRGTGWCCEKHRKEQQEARNA